MTYTTRFAPSPTGPLHIGHAYSALIAASRAAENNGQFLLRNEDIDRSRARADWEQAIFDDLHWLGLSWPTPVLRQSDHIKDYSDALDALWKMGCLFQCDCRRKDIAAAVSAPQEGAPLGPDGVIYPGTCRDKHPRTGPRPTDAVLRLDMAAALDKISHPLRFQETGPGDDLPLAPGSINLSPSALLRNVGDVVLARRDMGTSYHLSVVIDDARQGVTEVVRGADLFDATQIHVVLQSLLDLPTPDYHHHRLIRDETGRRLAKRDDARSISAYRADGASLEDIKTMIGLA